MAMFKYTAPWLVLQTGTDDPAKNLTGGQLLVDGVPVPTYEYETGVASPLKTGPHGVLERFTAEASFGMAKWGDVLCLIKSDEQLDSLEEAIQARDTAMALRTEVETWLAGATSLSHLFRGTDGRVYYSDTPVASGGGVVSIDPADNRVVVTFPVIKSPTSRGETSG